MAMLRWLRRLAKEPSSAKLHRPAASARSDLASE
jgi:hypothetical protein